MFRKKKKAEILFAVLLSRQNYEMGEQLEGKILFRKDEEVRFSAIYARFIGFESVALSHSPSVSESKRTKTKNILDTEFIPVASKSRAGRGDTEYPFKFLLPADLPPSFTSVGTAEIRYQVQAELVLKNGADSMESSVDVYVHQPLPAEGTLPQAHTEKKEWGLISRETLHFRGLPNKVLYDPGQEVAAEVTLENKTRKNLLRVVASVEQVIRYGKSTETHSLGSQKELPRALFPVPAAQRIDTLVSLTLPEQLLASSKSSMVSVSYALVLHCELEQGTTHAFRLPFATRGHIIEEETAVKIPPQLERIGSGGSIRRSGTPPPIPSREKRDHEMAAAAGALAVASESASSVSDEEDEFELPSHIEAPPGPAPWEGQPMASNFSARIHSPQAQLPLPYGHPCYYDAITHYKPPTYVEPPQPTKHNATTQALMGL